MRRLALVVAVLLLFATAPTPTQAQAPKSVSIAAVGDTILGNSAGRARANASLSATRPASPGH